MNDTSVDAPAIALSQVDFVWPGRAFRLSVDSFRAAKGSSTLLLGESGSGKSTLLSLICGINVPDSGSVSVMGTEISGLSGRERDRFRADTIGIVFQMFNLLPYANALDNIIVPLSFSQPRRARAGSPRTEALRLAQALGLDDKLVSQGPSNALSVGQQQRVAAARAMIGNPPILVADEPTSALDSSNSEEFLDVILGQVKERGTTLLMVSHDERIGDRFDHVLRLEEIAEISQSVPI